MIIFLLMDLAYLEWNVLAMLQWTIDFLLKSHLSNSAIAMYYKGFKHYVPVSTYLGLKC